MFTTLLNKTQVLPSCCRLLTESR